MRPDWCWCQFGESLPAHEFLLDIPVANYLRLVTDNHFSKTKAKLEVTKGGVAGRIKPNTPPSPFRTFSPVAYQTAS
jgi:hypothetical protein